MKPECSAIKEKMFYVLSVYLLLNRIFKNKIK